MHFFARLAVQLFAPLTVLGAAEQTATELPGFRYHGVVLEAADLKYRPHDDVIYPSVVRVAGRIAKPPGKFLDRTFVASDNPGVMSPSFIEDEGRRYLFFNIGPRLHNKIALVVAEPVNTPTSKP